MADTGFAFFSSSASSSPFGFSNPSSASSTPSFGFGSGTTPSSAAAVPSFGFGTGMSQSSASTPSFSGFGFRLPTSSSSSASFGGFGSNPSSASSAPSFGFAWGAASTGSSPLFSSFSSPASNVFGSGSTPGSNIFGSSGGAPTSNLFGFSSSGTGQTANPFGSTTSTPTPSTPAPSSSFGASTVFGSPAPGSSNLFGSGGPTPSLFANLSPAAAATNTSTPSLGSGVSTAPASTTPTSAPAFGNAAQFGSLSTPAPTASQFVTGVADASLKNTGSSSTSSAAQTSSTLVASSSSGTTPATSAAPASVPKLPSGSASSFSLSLKSPTAAASLASQTQSSVALPSFGVADASSKNAGSSSTSSAAQTSSTLVASSSSGTTPATSAAPASVPKLPSEITGKTVEEVIKEWKAELQEQEVIEPEIFADDGGQDSLTTLTVKVPTPEASKTEVREPGLTKDADGSSSDDVDLSPRSEIKRISQERLSHLTAQFTQELLEKHPRIVEAQEVLTLSVRLMQYVKLKHLLITDLLLLFPDMTISSLKEEEEILMEEFEFADYDDVSQHLHFYVRRKLNATGFPELVQAETIQAEKNAETKQHDSLNIPEKETAKPASSAPSTAIDTELLKLINARITGVKEELAEEKAENALQVRAIEVAMMKTMELAKEQILKDFSAAQESLHSNVKNLEDRMYAACNASEAKLIEYARDHQKSLEENMVQTLKSFRGEISEQVQRNKSQIIPAIEATAPKMIKSLCDTGIIPTAGEVQFLKNQLTEKASVTELAELRAKIDHLQPQSSIVIFDEMQAKIDRLESELLKISSQHLIDEKVTTGCSQKIETHDRHLVALETFKMQTEAALQSLQSEVKDLSDSLSTLAGNPLFDDAKKGEEGAKESEGKLAAKGKKIKITRPRTRKIKFSKGQDTGTNHLVENPVLKALMAEDPVVKALMDGATIDQASNPALLRQVARDQYSEEILKKFDVVQEEIRLAKEKRLAAMSPEEKAELDRQKRRSEKMTRFRRKQGREFKEDYIEPEADQWVSPAWSKVWEDFKVDFINQYYHYGVLADLSAEEAFKLYLEETNEERLVAQIRIDAIRTNIEIKAPQIRFCKPPRSKFGTGGIDRTKIENEAASIARMYGLSLSSEAYQKLKDRVFRKYRLKSAEETKREMEEERKRAEGEAGQGS